MVRARPITPGRDGIGRVDNMPAPAVDAAAALVADALDVPLDAIALISREPLGPGSVTGFTVTADPPVVAYVDTSLHRVPQETGMVLEGEARVWIHPADPHLPALAPAAFGHAAEVLLGRLGIGVEGMPEIVGYRPGRRAVLRVATATGAVWVKVVRPRRIDRIVQAHTALRDRGLPVPAVRGWSPDGLLVLDDAPGVPATDGGWQPEPLLDELDRLRARLATADLGWEARTSLAARLPWYRERLVAARRDRADIVDAIAQVAGAGAAADHSVQTIHGDLHLGQLFLGDDLTTVTGLIDVDTAGAGNPADDAAAFIAHAIASAVLTQEARDATAVWALADAATARWATDAGTRALTAIHLLGHALAATEAGAEARADAILERAAADLGI